MVNIYLSLTLFYINRITRIKSVTKSVILILELHGTLTVEFVVNSNTIFVHLYKENQFITGHHFIDIK